MANEIQPGKYTAKVVDYGIRSTKAGDPEPIIRFSFDKHEWNWRGSLKGGAAIHTLKALLTCGFTGGESDLAKLADGVDSKMLDTTQEVQIVVTLEAGQDGKMYPKIDWVNKIGGGQFKDTMTKDEAAKKLAGMNLGADLMKLKQELGLDKPKAAVHVDEIPF